MTRFVVGDDHSQNTLFPGRLDGYLDEDNPVRAIDVFVDELDLAGPGFGSVESEATGRPDDTLTITAKHYALQAQVILVEKSAFWNQIGISITYVSAFLSRVGHH
jgi:hypothetical protein